MEICKMFINGEFMDNGQRKMIPVINPATEQVIAKVTQGTAEDVNEAVLAAEQAQKAWAKLPAIKRAVCLRELAQGLRARLDEFAELLASEQGKVLSLARAEVEVSIDYIEFMAEFARRCEGEILQSDRENEQILVFKEPIGVAAGILPWNFPVYSIARKVAPALITGNTVVIKPSTETPVTAYEFAKIVAKSSLPKGVFNLVTGSGSVVGNAMASHPKVGIVSVTGSVPSGIAIMKAAADNVTKVSLELGGKGPAIVMPDADMELTTKAILDGRIINSGQACSCVERVYVHEAVAEEFIKKITAAMKNVKVGNPLTDLDADMGPMVSKAQLNEVEAAVEQAIKDGATLVCGGKRLAVKAGYYYEPTVFVNCQHDSAIMRNEIFGPVLPITTFKDLDEAIEMANDCEYGLTSFIFTQNMHVAMRACKEIKFGETYINRENFEAMQAFHAGWRKSGIGGDDGKYGVEEYLQTHVVYVDYDVKVK